MTQIQVINADITTLKVDAIVNAANPTLAGGGGVDGAIHSAAGPLLAEECSRLGGCAPGEAVTTRAYDLNAKIVIHTVGPVWAGGHKNENDVLARCYRHSLREAVNHGARTVAFPAISCGVYGYPTRPASSIAVNTVLDYLVDHDVFEGIIFCCRSREIEDALKHALSLHAL